MPTPISRTPATPRPRAAALPALPIAVRSRTDVSRRLKREVQEQVSAHLASHATLIDRVTVRFDDINGPRGGDDIDCEVKVDIAGLPPVLVTERGASPGAAFAAVVRRVTRAVRKELDRHGRSARRPARSGSGRRAGHAARPARASRTEAAEASPARPPRRSTGRTLAGGKPSQGKERAAVAEVIKPSTRAARAVSRGGRVRT